MSEKYPTAVITVDPVMTFSEIATILGVDRQTAYFWFVSGINKIRKNAEARRRLLELYEAKEALRTYPQQLPGDEEGILE
jgi:hypothetical protein